MEIERKYRIAALPEHYRSYPVRAIEQAYKHLLEKADGIVLTKDRYRIPMTGTYAHLTIELDVFSGVYSGLVLAEVEFPTVEEAEAFVPPEWFTEDVTMSGEYQNSRLSSGKVDFC